MGVWLSACNCNSASFYFVPSVCLSACDSGRLVELLLRNVCLPVCLSACDSGRLGSTRCCVDRCSELVELANRSRVARSRPCDSFASRSQVACKSAPNRFPNRFAEEEKSMPGSPKIDARRAQNRPPGGQKSSQDRPERPKSVPRAPKSAQEHPKSAQERPKSTPRAPQERLGPDFCEFLVIWGFQNESIF